MSQAVELAHPLEEYIYSVISPEPEPLQRLREETAKNPERSMQISAEQGIFMQVLARAIRAKKCLEIGVFTGYSSSSVALGLPSDGKLVACDVSEEWTSVARRYWRELGIEHKIDLRLAPALQTLDGLLAGGEAGSFDFVFIDADKKNYWNYFERCVELTRPGGVITADNVLWSGRVADPADQDSDTVAIREFNRRLREDGRVVVSMLAIRDGLTVACKK